MKKRDINKYIYVGGLALLIIQLLIIIYNVINGDLYTEEIITFSEELTFVSFISQTWAGILGTLLLCYLLFKRFKKGPDPFLEMAGALLWVIQILSFYSKGMNVINFCIAYIIGIFGTLIVLVIGFLDFVNSKKQIDDSDDNDALL